MHLKIGKSLNKLKDSRPKNKNPPPLSAEHSASGNNSLILFTGPRCTNGHSSPPEVHYYIRCNFYLAFYITSPTNSCAAYSATICEFSLSVQLLGATPSPNQDVWMVRSTVGLYMHQEMWQSLIYKPKIDLPRISILMRLIILTPSLTASLRCTRKVRRRLHLRKCVANSFKDHLLFRF